MARTRTQALSDDPADIERIARRYPSFTVRGPLVRALVAILVVAALGWYLQTALHNSRRPPVEATITGHWVVTPQQAGYDLLVVRPDPGRPAVCTVRAQAKNFEFVGDSEVTVPASDQEQLTVRGTLRTVREADAVSVEGCHLVG
ncbi:protein of unknown function [Raineyella antarctica]|uniref:DUF4307 domain-containing protein n=1 Tax=Raineyella antarctica TaxID=1577474 RepID=A0A1G6GD75_9ACTN|nr:DUF4307 domain-containing protein [Raineyella antarctica]SDB79948.1 protein of unknown function [Raineyella antarctica]